MVVVLSAAGCKQNTVQPSGPIAISGETMGTLYHIKVSELPRGTTSEGLKSKIEAELDRINDQMSTYHSESEISRFNRHGAENWFEVSPETAQVVHEALLVSEKSGGAFDITVAPLVNLWSFGPENRARTVPAEQEIRAALTRVGYRNVQVRISPPALRKLKGDIRIDLAAIAKGFGVDQIAELLGRTGISGYIVEIGGEIRVRGSKPGGSSWKVGIETPTEDRFAIQEVLALNNGALATSGDYRNFFKAEGKRYSHTIDPRTGRPVEHDLASVSVIAERCMKADAWATALMVLGPGQGYRFAKDQGLAALFLIRSGEGFVRRVTPAFNDLAPQEAKSGN
jgi:thiamine biosynthesis lipoprotein